MITPKFLEMMERIEGWSQFTQVASVCLWFFIHDYPYIVSSQTVNCLSLLNAIYAKLCLNSQKISYKLKRAKKIKAFEISENVYLEIMYGYGPLYFRKSHDKNLIFLWLHNKRVLLLLRLSCFSCVWLCDPIDGSPPGSPISGILQARTLEWVAIAFSE